MKLDIDFLKERVCWLDRASLLRLRSMLNQPDWIRALRFPADEISRGISEGAQVYRTNLANKPYSEKKKRQLESRSVFFELSLLNKIEAQVKENLRSVLQEIDNCLLAHPS